MRTVRLSQAISPFGVGAVIDVMGESLMGVDISEWPYKATTRIESRRLQEGLGVAELRSPPSVPSRPSAKTPGIPYQRFPRWLFCQDCRRMTFYRTADETGKAPTCGTCGAALVPMRFIAVCTGKGHVTDVPWDRWAHSAPSDDDQRACRDHALVFESTGVGEGLAGLVVRCRTCRASRHLGDLTSSDSLRRIGFRCPGTQPWQARKTDGCDARIEVLQRGATNVTLSETTTALDIPDVGRDRDDLAMIRTHRNFEDLRGAPDAPAAPVFLDLIMKNLGVTEDQVRAALHADDDMQQGLTRTRSGFLGGEWDAFIQAGPTVEESAGTPDFKVSRTCLLDTDGRTDTRTGRAGGDPATPRPVALLAGLVDRVVLAHRLREIRVLHGFRRYTPESDLVKVDLGPRGRTPWLPAVEAFGEGVFVSFDEERIAEWSRIPEVHRRVAVLERRRRDSILGSRLPVATPRSVMLHTFAHLLMRRLSFSCGYSAASLCERIYSEELTVPQAGILIYTAAGDTEGTLGGLVRQGEPPRLVRTLVAALEDAAWCSADPLCRESRGQGMGSLNLSACHGCCLVAETSCERSNLLLDRVLVVGDETTPGFFQEIIDASREQAVLLREC